MCSCEDTCGGSCSDLSGAEVLTGMLTLPFTSVITYIKTKTRIHSFTHSMTIIKTIYFTWKIKARKSYQCTIKEKNRGSRALGRTQSKFVIMSKLSLLGLFFFFKCDQYQPLHRLDTL